MAPAQPCIPPRRPGRSSRGRGPSTAPIVAATPRGDATILHAPLSRPLFAIEATEPTDAPSILTEEPERPLADLVRDWLGDGRFADTVEFLIEPVLQIVLVVLIAIAVKYVANKIIARVVKQMKTPSDRHKERARPISGRRATRADALGTLLRSIANVIVVTIAAFMVLAVFGINLAPLIAGAGIIGLAIGFGAQNLVADFLAGVFMLAEDQYGIGDFIEVDGIIGMVEGVSLRTTEVRDLNGTLWHIPNGQLNKVGNMTHEWARAVLDVGVSYGTDTDEASALILGVAQEMAEAEEFAGDFLGAPEIWGVQDLGADAVDIRLVVRTTPGAQWRVGRELRRRIKYALDGADIEIPFSQRTVWLRTDARGTDTPLIDVGDDRSRN